MEWQGLPIWTLQPQRDGMNQGWDSTPAELPGRIISEFYTVDQYPCWYNMWTYVIEGRTAIKEVTDFFDARRGKLYPFWCPSWEDGYRMYAGGALTPGSYYITVDKYAPVVYDGDLRSRLISRKRLRIRTAGTGGTYYMAHVIGFDNTTYTNADVLRLDVAYDAAYGMDVNTTVFDFMYCVRFNTDVLTYRMLARDVCEVRIPMVEVPYETPGLTTY